MNIRDFMDLQKLQDIQDSFSNATGLAAIAVDNDGEYITEGSNKRCIKCDTENHGTYFCHSGLMDFSIDIMVGDEKVGSVIGGQVLSSPPDEEEFRKKAVELVINTDSYITSCELLKQIVNHVVNLEYFKNTNGGKLSTLSEEIKHATDVIQKINTNTRSLNSIANKQKMLSLNASIEAARSGEAGVGFAVVAKSMGDLSSQSATIYSDIEKSVVEITSTIEKLASLFEEE